jgi:tetratricopeptide (TPR) repeat protein
MSALKVLTAGVCLLCALLPFGLQAAGLQAADREAVSSYVLAAKDRRLGDYQGAERVLRAALESQSISTSNRAELTVSLADLLREEARGSQAKALLDEAVHMEGLTPRERINLLIETAELDLDFGLCAESRALWNEISEIGGAEAAPLEADVDGGLGESWMAEGNLARAEPLLRRSLQLFRNSPGSSPLQVATALASLARLYLHENKLALADEALAEAIAKDEASLSDGHPQIAALRELRSIILSRHGDTQEARDELERARVIMADHFGAESIAVAVVYTGLGDVELRANKPEAAVMQYGKALRLFREAGAESSGPGVAVAARYSAAVLAAGRSASRAKAGVSGLESFREK